MLEVEDSRMNLADDSYGYNLGSCEEIKLYEHLSLALELMEEHSDNFKVIGSGIGGGIDFHISTPYPDGLPESVGSLFFNVSTDFKVEVNESKGLAGQGERLYNISIKKDW